jgi:hypothetical protein
MRIVLAFLLVLLLLGGAVAAGIYLLTRLSRRSSSDRPEG